jgi:CRISPR-associated protein Cas1
MIKRTIYFGNPAYLSFKNKQLVVTKPDMDDYRVTVPVEDIAILVLDNAQITITHQLIQALQDNTVAIISCDKSHLPASIMLPIAGHHIMTERMRKQIDVSITLKRQLWKQTIEAKVRNQAILLEKLDKDAGRLYYLLDKIEPGDKTNIEGRAAAYYWKELFGVDYLRDRYGEIPNAHLNYAYSIIRAVVARALVSTGLHPSFGLFHSNKYNIYCLADDLMEPYRPFVDELVYNLYINGDITDDFLDTKQKASLLKVAACDVLIDDKRSPLLVAVSRTTNSLFECYDSVKRKILYPSFYDI